MLRFVREFILFVLIITAISVFLPLLWYYFSLAENQIINSSQYVANQMKINVNMSTVALYPEVAPYMNIFDVALAVFIIASAAGLFIYTRRR
jgi:hypothetical protein